VLLGLHHISKPWPVTEIRAAPSSAFSDSSLRKLVANGQIADAHFSKAYCRRRTVTVVTVAIPASAVDKELGGAAADHDHLNGQGFIP
jgi:hypothetical protein